MKINVHLQCTIFHCNSKKKIIIQESKTELVKMLMFINKLIITFINTKMNKSMLGEFFIFFFT